ncbi:MAG: hypothetical protein J4F36_08430 [Nitrosopumilaceae archaeon]|nr:hypothetical protein [Nitrosopumilaceae archaeon]
MKLFIHSSIILGIFFLILITSPTSVSFASVIGSPNFQLESGIAPEDIVCNDNLVLVIRTNGDVACVKVSTSERFGWEIIEKYSPSIMDVELDPILYSGVPISANMIKSGDPQKVSDSDLAVEPTMTIGTNDLIVSNLPRVGDIINATFVVTYDSSNYPPTLTFPIDFRVWDGLEFVNIPDGYELTYKEPQSSWGKTFRGIHTLSLPVQEFDYNETKSFTVQIKSTLEGSLAFVIGSTETLLTQDYYAKYPDEIPEDIKIELPKTPEEQVAFEKKYGASFGTTTIRTDVTEDEYVAWLEKHGYSDSFIENTIDRIYPKDGN